jgi:hypothetical protein
MSASREKHAGKHTDYDHPALASVQLDVWKFAFDAPGAVATLSDRAYEQLCSSVGFGGRRAVDLEHAGLRALGIYRLRSQIGLTDRLACGRVRGDGASREAMPRGNRVTRCLTRRDSGSF